MLNLSRGCLGHRKLISILLTGIISFGIILAKEPVVYAGQSDAQEVILSSGIVRIFPPIEIKDILYYQDGGTTGIILMDSRGKTFYFCLDGRLRVQESGKALEPYHIYIGATHPEGPGAQSIPVGGKEEKSILKLLQIWLDDQVPAQEQEKLFNTTSVINLSEEEIAAYRVIRVIESLKAR